MSKRYSLSSREVKFFKYFEKYRLSHKRKYMFTQYLYIQHALGYKSKGGARYLIEGLVKKKLINVEKRVNPRTGPYLKVTIARPRVLKKLLEAYKAENPESDGDLILKKEKSVQASETEELQKKSANSYNLNIINQLNHTEKKEKEKRKPTNHTVQDMLSAFNEEFGCAITLSHKIARWMYAAFKQKFKSVEVWKNYLRFKKRGRIRDSMRFLMYLLTFATINASFADCSEIKEASKMVPQEDYKERALKHIESLRESEICKAVRKRFLTRYYGAAGEYMAFLRYIMLGDVNGELIIRSQNKFIEDWVNSRYGYILERYYDEQKAQKNKQATLDIEWPDDF